MFFLWPTIWLALGDGECGGSYLLTSLAVVKDSNWFTSFAASVLKPEFPLFLGWDVAVHPAVDKYIQNRHLEYVLQFSSPHPSNSHRGDICEHLCDVLELHQVP